MTNFLAISWPVVRKYEKIQTQFLFDYDFLLGGGIKDAAQEIFFDEIIQNKYNFACIWYFSYIHFFLSSESFVFNEQRRRIVVWKSK